MLKENTYKVVLLGILFIVLIFTSNVKAGKFNMSYLYGNYDYSSLVTRTGNSLDEVSPSYFDLYSSGNLKLNTVDMNFINEMHSKGIKVVPFLSNHWDRDKGRRALSNIEKLTNQIVEAIERYDLDGINIDIENVTEADRENYTLLVKTLREKLGNNRSISVAVAANPNNWQTGWHGSYDYTALAKYADYLMLMTYDEHYQGGEAGPVASIDFVENSIKYALERVEPGKIVLGIPFFGRYWQNGYNYGGYGISLTRIESLTNKYKTTFYYDKEKESVKAIMTIKSQEIKPTVNGNILNTGTYTIWYENEESISAKLDLVNKYKLKGTGSWSLGQETASTWNYYSSKLNEDVDESPKPVNPDENEESKYSSWAKESIKYVKNNGWMLGKSNEEFYPKDNLTRAEFATIIVRILNLDEYTTKECKYNDIDGYWAENYINLVTASGYMEGYGDGTFKPKKTITRAEVVTVLARMELNENLQLNEAKKLSFADINTNYWAYESIKKMLQYGVINGYDDATFAPNKSITREEMAVILKRAF